jgi:hypothetical protein
MRRACHHHVRHRVHRVLALALLVLGSTALLAGPALALEDARPAGGTPTEDLIPASIVGALIVIGVWAFGAAHRSGRTQVLNRISAFAERTSGLPAFASVPMALVGVSLLVAVFGFYWDVSSHIDAGRDEGPFANPSHWFIILGLLGIALGGVLALLIGADEDSPTALRYRRGWRVPVGGVLLTVCGVIALLGFPLDDVWHRIFGQDVTLWSPTHIQMVGGASLATLCLWILVIEGRRSTRPMPRPELNPRLTDIMLAGAFLIGASTLQAEYDYAVPQFRLLYHPVLIMVAAGIALVPARVRLGRYGAIKAVLFFLAVRGILTLLITPFLGRTLLHFPLYLGAAVAVELAATRVDTDKQLTFGAVAGLGIATLGLATEWAWTHLWMPIPWPSTMLVETLLVAVPAAIAAAVVGGFIARALAEPDQPRQQVPTSFAVAAGVVVIAALVWPIPMTDEPGAEVEVVLSDVPADPDGGDAADDGRHVAATISLSPPDLAEEADYLNVTAWQGADWRHGVHSFADPLERVEEGVYRTTRPIPVHGDWKALIRLHDGRTMVAAPIFMPEDAAIPAEEVPAEDEFVRDFVYGEELLLREMRDAPAWITGVAYLLTLGILVVWVGGIGWGVRHLRRSGVRPPT